MDGSDTVCTPPPSDGSEGTLGILIDVDSGAYTNSNGFTWKIYVPSVYTINTAESSSTTGNTRW